MNVVQNLESTALRVAILNRSDMEACVHLDLIEYRKADARNPPCARRHHNFSKQAKQAKKPGSHAYRRRATPNNLRRRRPPDSAPCGSPDRTLNVPQSD